MQMPSEDCLDLPYDRSDTQFERSSLWSNPKVSYHKTCLMAAEPKTGKVPFRDLLDILGPNYSPMLSEDTRRDQRTRRVLADRLPRMFRHVKAKLPPEIWRMVVDYGGDDFVRWCAVETAREIWITGCTGDELFSLSKGIWAHYIFIDGVRYVQRLTYAEPDYDNNGVMKVPDGRTCVEILAPLAKRSSAQREEKVLYVLEDHLGIRQLVFANPDDDLSKLSVGNIRDPWWRTVDFTEGDMLSTRTDGAKLRIVDGPPERYRGNMSLESMWPVLWPVPTSPSAITAIRFGVVPFSKPTESSGPRIGRHIKSMTCNAPDTTAYSAIQCETGLVGLYAHRESDDTSPGALSRMYSDAHAQVSDSTWNHFPVAPGEKLVDLYARYNKYGALAVLLFRTSRGRSWIIEHTKEDYTVRTEEQNPNHICTLYSADSDNNTDDAALPRIHFNATPVGLEFLAFENVGFIHRRPPARLRKTTVFGHPPGEEREAAREAELEAILAIGADPEMAAPVPAVPTQTAADSGGNGGPSPKARKRAPEGLLFLSSYHVSTVCLNNVASVTPSYKLNENGRRVVLCGMLFEYRVVDDVQRPPALLGEYRLDRVGERVDAIDAESLYIGSLYDDPKEYDDTVYAKHISFNATQQEYMGIATTKPDLEGSPWDWQCLPLKGHVDMWYSHGHSYIYSPTRSWAVA